jgi:hypothetical protein
MRKTTVASWTVCLLLIASLSQLAIEGAGANRWERATSGLPGSGAYFGVKFADVNGDGDLDVVGASDGEGIRVFLGDGSGSWTAVPTHPATSGGYGDVSLGDVDGDGDVDIFAGSPGEGTGNPKGLHVFRGDGSGGFSEITSSSNLPTNGRWRGVAEGDLNGDGNLDLAATNGYGDAQGIHAFIGDGQGGFVDQSSGLPVNSDRDSNVVIADFNKDGNLDLAAGGSAGVDVYLGNGGSGGAMSWTQSSSGLPDGRFSGLSVADVDDDGRKDLVVSAYGAGRGEGVRFYRNVDKGSSWKSISEGLPVEGDYIENSAADVTGDGHVDIVVSGGYAGTEGVHVYAGNGKGVWNRYSPGLPKEDYYMGIDLGDIDDDGDLDILVGKRTGGGGLEVYENPGEVFVGPDTPGEPWDEGGIDRNTILLLLGAVGVIGVAYYVLKGGKEEEY